MTEQDAALKDAWHSALTLWNVQLRDPEISPGGGDAVGSFAWYGFPPQVTLDPTFAARMKLDGEFPSVFAHEVGHHVLAPGTRIDALKIRHQMARCLSLCGALVISPDKVAMMANLWNDLLVNARVATLQRRAEPASVPGIITVMAALRAPQSNRTWWLYMRTYERLWSLPANTLCDVLPPAPLPPEADHSLGINTEDLEKIDLKYRTKERELRAARLVAAEARAALAATTVTQPQLDADALAGAVRSFMDDPVTGALAFGTIVAPYVIEDARGHGAGDGPEQAGCAAVVDDATADELGKVLADRRMWEDPQDYRPDHAPDLVVDDGRQGLGGMPGAGQSLGLARTLALYPALDPDQVALTWYRAEAAPYVKKWTRRGPAGMAEELPGPTEQWEVGDDLADIDWGATLSHGATVIPGVTTRRRTFLAGTSTPHPTSIELDLYIDSSGSMAHPHRGSPAILAGTILAQSILSGGGAVRVTSFSGPGEVTGQPEFLTKSEPVMRGLLSFLGGGTSFPLDLYGSRYAGLKLADEFTQRHVVVLSDDGLTSMFGAGNEQYAGVAARVRKVLTTATLILDVRGHTVVEEARQAGYDVILLGSMAEAPAACAALAKKLAVR